MTDLATAGACAESMIPGVYNYCDDWCARCPVTTRCRAYGFRQRLESGSLGQTPDPLADEVTFTREIAAADGLPTPGLDAQLAGDPDGDYVLREDDEPLARHALAYAVASEILVRKAGWRAPSSLSLPTPPPPLDVIVWYHLFLAMKTRRALIGAYRAERGDPDALDDARGSAKIALISIDRSRAALKSAATGRVRQFAKQLVVMLDILEAGLEARVPNSRQYVRMGLDAPAP
jgi:hypothetical protein